jgi:hypothetical protein
MTAAEKLSLMPEMTATVRSLAAAGIRQRYPQASPREQFLRLAILTSGIDLARSVYPDIDTLGLE